jgi:nucleotide-binding universal stress UspA family protein
VSMKTILAPIDFSSATDGVISAAIDLAEATRGRVVLLHVVQPPILTSDYGLAMESFQEAVMLSEKHASKRLAEIQANAAARYPNVIVEQASGSAIGEIVDAAARHKADYLLMGSHGHTALYDLIVGSTTHGILRKIHCPVVIVPPAPGDRK